VLKIMLVGPAGLAGARAVNLFGVLMVCAGRAPAKLAGGA
jgi:hypothetical protein